MSPPKNITKNWSKISSEEILEFFVVAMESGLSDKEALERSKKLGNNFDPNRNKEAAQYFTNKTVRGGRLKTIKSYNLVLGDIVVLEAGDLVPADLRILEVEHCSIQQESITGISAPAHKNAFTINAQTKSLLDMKNMAFAGCPVLTGSLLGIVVAVGPNTEQAKMHNKSKKLSFSKRRTLKKFNNNGLIVNDQNSISNISSIDTVVLNVGLGVDGIKEAVRVLAVGMGKNLIIITDTENYHKISKTIPGTLKIDAKAFREKSNKSLLESDHPILVLIDIGQQEILRYINLLHLKNREVLWVDSGKEIVSLFTGASFSVVVADTANQTALDSADIILPTISANSKAIKQIETLIK